MPEHAAVRFFLQVKQVHLAAQLAVVAPGRFLQTRQMRIELLLVQPAGAIDARELRVVLVAAPVCPGDAHQLVGSGIELAGAGQVRAAAHIEPVVRSEEHTSELQSLMRISYAVSCLKKKKTN